MYQNQPPLLIDGPLTVERLKTAWREIEKIGKRPKPGMRSVILILNSPGGEMEAALETVKRLDALGCPFTVKIYRAESAATFIALSARKRVIVREGVFRLHLGDALIPSNMLVTTEKVARPIVEEAKRWRAHMFALLEKRGFPQSGPLMNRLLVRNELLLKPEECLKIGLVTDIF